MTAPSDFEAGLIALQPKLWRFARRLTRSNDRADDLTQDTLARALSRKHLYEPGSNLSGWATTMMRNLWVSQGLRDRQYATDGEDLAAILPPQPPAQFDSIVARETVRAIKALNPERRAIVLAVRLDGATQQEAAERFGIPFGTAKSRLSSATHELELTVEGTHTGERGHRR